MSTTPKGQRFAAFGGPSSPGIEIDGSNIVSLTVDGVEVRKRCYEASEPSGFADCFKLRNGNPYLLPSEDGIAWERLTGVVEIRLEGEAA